MPQAPNKSYVLDRYSWFLYFSLQIFLKEYMEAQLIEALIPNYMIQCITTSLNLCDIKADDLVFIYQDLWLLSR